MFRTFLERLKLHNFQIHGRKIFCELCFTVGQRSTVLQVFLFALQSMGEMFSGSHGILHTVPQVTTSKKFLHCHIASAVHSSDNTSMSLFLSVVGNQEMEPDVFML